MKRTQNIALIGFRASGKSLVGRLLAEELGRTFVDMDDQLVSSFGMDIDQWVGAHGWESFRREESQVLLRLEGKEGLVIATGGGVVLSVSNRELLKRSFLVVWLKASPETTYSRTIGDPRSGANRPALTVLPLDDEIRQILSERMSLYQETADIILETDEVPPEELVLLVRRHL